MHDRRRCRALPQLVDQAAVEVEPLRVDRADAVRQHARPGDAEAVRLHAQRLHQRDVLLVAVVVVAGDVARVALEHRALLLAEHVPHRRPACRPRWRRPRPDRRPSPRPRRSPWETAPLPALLAAPRLARRVRRAGQRHAASRDTQHLPPTENLLWPSVRSSLSHRGSREPPPVRENRPHFKEGNRTLTTPSEDHLLRRGERSVASPRGAREVWRDASGSEPSLHLDRRAAWLRRAERGRFWRASSRQRCRLSMSSGRRKNRTFNKRIKSPLLCQLSYAPEREMVQVLTSSRAASSTPIGRAPARVSHTARPATAAPDHGRSGHGPSVFRGPALDGAPK